MSLHRYENIFKRERASSDSSRHSRSWPSSTRLLFILHPPTESQIDKLGFRARLAENPRIELRPRYTYFDFISLLEAAEFVVTDGGSIQEEASYLGQALPADAQGQRAVGRAWERTWCCRTSTPR